MFNIDYDNSDDTTMYVEVPSHGMVVCIKREREGIVVDVYVLDEPIATLTAWLDDIEGQDNE
jgi:hypothetical protein